MIETGIGNCHVYVDESADFSMALQILINAKCSRPSVCNAAETLLIHENIKNTFLPLAAKALLDNGVEIRGCESSMKIVPDMKSASEEDWATEYDDLIMAVRIVRNLDEALEHIAKYGNASQRKHHNGQRTKRRAIFERSGCGLCLCQCVH